MQKQPRKSSPTFWETLHETVVSRNVRPILEISQGSQLRRRGCAAEGDRRSAGLRVVNEEEISHKRHKRHIKEFFYVPYVPFVANPFFLESQPHLSLELPV